MSCLEVSYKRYPDHAKVLAIVPARKGSRRIIGKNTRLLGKKPLVVWSFDCAKKAKSLDRIVVSTDDEKVRELAEEWRIEVPYFPRRKELCEDVDTALVLQDIVEFLSRKEGYKPTHICLLQPTSPFRLPSEIDKCVEIALETDCETALTVRRVKENPYWCFEKVGEEKGSIVLLPYEDVDLKGDVLVSQTLPTIYFPTGSVYVIQYDLLMQEQRIFGEHIRCFETPWQTSIDIETEEDIQYSEFLLQKWAEEAYKKQAWYTVELSGRV